MSEDDGIPMKKARNSATDSERLLTEALDGSESVIRPLILVILLYIAILFTALLFSAISWDRTRTFEDSQTVESLIQEQRLRLASSLDYASNLLNEVAEQNEDQVDIDAAASTVLKHLSHAGIASQSFVTLLDGGLISEHITQGETLKGITAKEAQERTDALIDIARYTRSSVTDIVEINGQFFVVAVSTVSCSQLVKECGLIAVQNLDTAMARIPHLPSEEFLINTTINQRSGVNSARIKNLTGETIGWFHWQSRSDGRNLLQEIMPWLSLVTAVVLVICWLVWRRGIGIAAQTRAHQEEAKHRALHDPLTGLANRTLMHARLEEAAREMSREKKGYALHLIDLDHFKTVNDTLGHQAGDDLLEEAATRLKSVCRAGDTVARLGGDEFAVIQRDVSSPNSAARLARRATEKLSAAYKISGQDVYISGSVGVSVCQSASAPITEIMRQADIALYRAKGAGRNQFCFFEREMDDALQERSAIESDLRQALQAEDLTVVFQPQVSADGKHIRGMEALVRWKHAERGVVPPSLFVPVAEETGLIRKLGEFVMRKSFETARQWPEITMAVNVSAGELHHPEYAAHVIALADEVGVRTDQIELEITETVLLEDSARVTRTIKALKAAGFRIALDDFGTGYSSLSYLRRHQVDKLKIDQSFVSSIGVREDAGAVVQAIIHLGEALGLSVTAEGVETEMQRDALKTRGCAYLQGYLFSRPIRADQIGALVENFKTNRTNGRRQGAA